MIFFSTNQSGKHLTWSLFCNFTVKELSCRCFLMNISKFCRTSILLNTCECLMLLYFNDCSCKLLFLESCSQYVENFSRFCFSFLSSKVKQNLILIIKNFIFELIRKSQNEFKLNILRRCSMYHQTWVPSVPTKLTVVKSSRILARIDW